MHRAVAEINLAAIASNVLRLKAAAPNSSLMAVVKADGYGHGMIPAARAARSAGADYLGVAFPEEAVAIRESGDGGPLLCWLTSPGDDLRECVERGIELSVSSLDSLAQAVDAGHRADSVARIHLKIDTGLGRNGATPADWQTLVDAAATRQAKGVLEVVGVWSHLASADEPESPVTARQVQAFRSALDAVADSGLTPRLRHLANSAGTLAHPDTHFDLVRCGVAVYGLTPGAAVGSSASLGLIPAMRLDATVALVKRVPGGHGVSYGHRYRTRRSTQLALVPLGYADGVPRAGSGRIPVVINGQRFSVAGTVAMDQIVLDVGEAKVRAGDIVHLFGPGSNGEPSVDEWAAACGTINYEIVTRLGPRVARRHVTGGG